MSFVCLYHRTDSINGSEEDILQKAFGGRKTSRTLICGSCNNKLGGSIDKKFAESLEWVTTLLNPSGRRRPPATLKNVTDVDGNKWHIAPGGKPVLPYQSIGPTSWKGDPSQLEMAKGNAQAKAIAMGIEDPNIEVRHEKTQSGAFRFQLKMDNETAFRSACKSALELLALIGFDEDDRRSDLLLDARDFVMNGTPFTEVGWLERPQIPELFAHFDNAILLVQADDCSVYWEFVLYGGVIAVSGRFAPLKKRFGSYLYRVCPRTGDVFDGSVELVVPKDLATWSPVTTAALQQRTDAALQKLEWALMTESVLDDLPSDFDTLDPVKQNEYLFQASVKLTQGLVDSVAERTETDHMDVLKTLYKRIANQSNAEPQS